MVQVPIISGIYTDNGPDFRSAYPNNLVPVPKANGISEGYLRPGDGVTYIGDLPGFDRGGMFWNGSTYRVAGTTLVRVDSSGAVFTIGTIPGANYVTMIYSFDYLAICADAKLYLYSPSAGLAQVTDVDLGPSLSVTWIDGYFVSTDGTSLISTNLGNPFNVNPLHYGSSEVNPDRVVAVTTVRNELVAVNRYSVEVFSTIGGTGFPFQRIDGAFVPRGAIGPQAQCIYGGVLTFLGGGENEPNSIWSSNNGAAVKLATREIETVLLGYTEAELALTVMEVKADRMHEHLLIHLPDRCLVYDATSSAVMGQPVWFTLQSGYPTAGQYRARGHVWAFGAWSVADPAGGQHGYCDPTVSTHWGEQTCWEFGTTIIYNGGNNGIIHDLELVALTGRVTNEPYIETSYTFDGQTWSQPKTIKAGLPGDRAKALKWFQQGPIVSWRAQRFKGDSNAHLSFARLEASIEAMAW